MTTKIFNNEQCDLVCNITGDTVSDWVAITESGVALREVTMDGVTIRNRISGGPYRLITDPKPEIKVADDLTDGRVVVAEPIENRINTLEEFTGVNDEPE